MDSFLQVLQTSLNVRVTFICHSKSLNVYSHYFTVAVQCLTCETILLNQQKETEKETPLHILENYITFPSIRADLASVRSCSHTHIDWKGSWSLIICSALRVFSVSPFSFLKFFDSWFCVCTFSIYLCLVICFSVFMFMISKIYCYI